MQGIIAPGDCKSCFRTRKMPLVEVIHSHPWSSTIASISSLSSPWRTVYRSNRPSCHRSSGQPILSGVAHNIGVVDIAQAAVIIRADPYPAVAVLAQSQDQIAGELVRRRVNSHPVLHDLIKPAAPGAHPKRPRSVFEHGLYVVMAQALPFGKDGERPGGQPDQPFVRADPDVAPAILEKRIDLVVRHAAAIHFGAKTAIDEPIQTTVGSHPKIGLAVLKDCADHIIGQTVGSAVIVNPPRSIPD